MFAFELKRVVLHSSLFFIYVYIVGDMLTDMFFFLLLLQNTKNIFKISKNVEDEVVSIGDSCSDNDTDENRHSSGESQHAKNGYDHPTKKLKMVNINRKPRIISKTLMQMENSNFFFSINCVFPFCISFLFSFLFISPVFLSFAHNKNRTLATIHHYKYDHQ